MNQVRVHQYLRVIKKYIKIMQTLYIKTISLLVGLMFITISGQQVLGLNENYEEYPNYTYFKDLNNELGPYVGNYTANFEGNEISLYITKEDKKLHKLLDRYYYQDVLIIKYIVKNTSGSILHNTQNMGGLQFLNYHKITSSGTFPALGDVRFYYTGTNCHVGWGKIILKKINSTQFTWEYRPNSMLLVGDECPSGTDTTVYLPVTKDLVFTKQ